MEHYADRQGIFFLEPYDPEKVPVLMVHGILSSPLMWRDLTNANPRSGFANLGHAKIRIVYDMAFAVVRIRSSRCASLEVY